jgi:hypothetical protein
VALLRLDQLPPAQRRNRDLVLSRLKKAGYKPTDVEVSLENGMALAQAVSMTRSNGPLDITVEVWNESPPVTLELTRANGDEVRLLIDDEGRLDELLGFIIANQNELNEDNYRGVVRDLLEQFPKTFADLGEDGVRQLVSDKAGELEWRSD